MKRISYRSSIKSKISAWLIFTAAACLFPPPIYPQSDSGSFIEFLKERFIIANGTSALPETVAGLPAFDCAYKTDLLAFKVLLAYGSMFAASSRVILPARCVFTRFDDVRAFQRTLSSRRIIVDGSPIELQTVAADSLEAAIKLALANGAVITPLDGSIAGGRDYNATVTVWNKRYFAALNYWRSKGAISDFEIAAAQNEPAIAQARRVIEWERQGYLFGPGRSSSILKSVAPPGTSQHLSLIAFDTEDYDDEVVRAVMNSNGWFQTVIGDPTHFTFLDRPIGSLYRYGLIPVTAEGRTYWVPDLGSKNVSTTQP